MNAAVLAISNAEIAASRHAEPIVFASAAASGCPNAIAMALVQFDGSAEAAAKALVISSRWSQSDLAMGNPPGDLPSHGPSRFRPGGFGSLAVHRLRSMQQMLGSAVCNEPPGLP